MRKVGLLFFCLLCFTKSEATHVRCGQIRLERINNLSYKISLLVYTNLGSQIKFGSGILNFGDGSNHVVLPTLDNTIRTDLGPDVGTVSYSVNHEFPSFGNYTISFIEQNLNAGIINVTNSVETRFYLETRILINSNEDYSSPVFLTEPSFKYPVGRELSFSAGATDNNDYKLTYELINPLEPGRTNFSLPENISINYYNGLATWDGNYNGVHRVGEYLIAVRVTQYNRTGTRMGYVIKTFQIILEDAVNEMEIISPINDVNNKILIDENKERTIKVILKSNTYAPQLHWQPFFDKNINNNLSFSQYDSVSATGTIKVGLLKLNGSPNIVRENPYLITLRAGLGTTFSKDINYLLLTRNVDLPVITSVSELKNLNIRAYPNPFSDFLQLDTYPDSLVEVSILNDGGQLVLRSVIQSNDLIETFQLSPGIYILKLKTTLGTVTQRVVKR